MPRPETPELHKGDRLFMYSGTPGRRDGKRYTAVVVVTLGPKYVGVIQESRAEAYAADPENNRWYVRKFLREDMREGERGKRIGYTASLATAEQRAYDERLFSVGVYLRDVLGVDVRASSPLRDPEVARKVVSLLNAAESSWRPPA